MKPCHMPQAACEYANIHWQNPEVSCTCDPRQVHHLGACWRCLDPGKGAQESALLEQGAVKEEQLAISARCCLHDDSTSHNKLNPKNWSRWALLAVCLTSNNSASVEVLREQLLTG